MLDRSKGSGFKFLNIKMLTSQSHKAPSKSCIRTPNLSETSPGLAKRVSWNENENKTNVLPKKAIEDVSIKGDVPSLLPPTTRLWCIQMTIPVKLFTNRILNQLGRKKYLLIPRIMIHPLG